MHFEHVIIDSETPGSENDVCLVADVNGDGFNDIIIGGKVGAGNLVWYEWPDWRRHTIGTANLEAGGVTLDLTGNGLPDLVAGRPQWRPEDPGKELYWFENSGDGEVEWTRRLITDEFHKYHDQCVGDIDGDGLPELIFCSQVSGVLGYYKIPPNPREEPWDRQYLHIIAEDLEVEGLALADLDDDGEMELVAGPNWFKREEGRWLRNVIASDYRLTRVQVVSLSEAGKLDVVLCEGESEPGRLAIASGFPDWRIKVIADDLFHPHSLECADFTGNGSMDIFVGEMGLGKNPGARILVYENLGNGRFAPNLVDSGKPTHEAKLGDFGNTGRISIVGKPYNPGRHVEMWINEPE